MENLKKLRKQKGLSQSAFAEILHASQNTVSQWESGEREPSYEITQQIADYFDVSVDYLLGRDILPKNAIPVDLSTFVKIPVYGEVSAGLGCLAEDNIIGYELVSPESINKYENYFFLKVKGDSMEPEIRECDLALIQKCTSVDSGSVAVVIIDDENGVIKKVNYGDDWIELVSFNPYYPPRRFEGADVQRIMVVGLVKQIVRKFN